jgi:hypothetical protein
MYVVQEQSSIGIVDTRRSFGRPLEMHHELGVRGERDGKVEFVNQGQKLSRMDVSKQADALPRWDHSS